MPSCTGLFPLCAVLIGHVSKKQSICPNWQQSKVVLEGTSSSVSPLIAAVEHVWQRCHQPPSVICPSASFLQLKVHLHSGPSNEGVLTNLHKGKIRIDRLWGGQAAGCSDLLQLLTFYSVTGLQALGLGAILHTVQLHRHRDAGERC